MWASYPDKLSYDEYHMHSRAIGDVDPSYSLLRYICERYELNTEQRYWLAYIYSTCYCGATTFYIYNEFPDWENVDFDRADRWWAANRDKVLFQTDRRWVRSRNQWVDMLRSYANAVRPCTQEMWMRMHEVPLDPYTTYRQVSRDAANWFQMGRFGLWLYTEAVHVVTGFPMEPPLMDLADAESCRNGLAMAIGRPDLNNHDDDHRLTRSQMVLLQEALGQAVRSLKRLDPSNNLWNIETTLCAYKKYHIGKRWPGYYIDRQHNEIAYLQARVTDGVDWDVLWDYRRETFHDTYLMESKAPKGSLNGHEIKVIDETVHPEGLTKCE